MSGADRTGSGADLMNDTSRAVRPAIALSGINLSLGRGAARVHILKDIDLHIGSGEAIGLVGPSGSGQDHAADGAGRAGARRHRLDRGGRRRPRRARRGRAGALSRPQRRHRVPVFPPDPDHDGAGERRGAAGARRRSRRVRPRPRGARRGRPRRAAQPLSGAAFRRRAAARRARPRARAQSGDPGGRRADRQSRRGDRQADHRTAVRRATSSAAPRSSW